MQSKTGNNINISKKILAIATNIILLFLLIIGLLLVITLMPIKGNYQIMSVLSGSMSPTIPVGSLIVVKPSPSYHSGDVVTFLPVGKKLKNESVTHRIYSIRTEDNTRVYQTKGDANATPDIETITEDRIIGKYLVSIAFLGYVLSYVKTLPGLILLILLPSIIIIFEEVKKIRKESKLVIQKKREKAKQEIGLSAKKHNKGETKFNKLETKKGKND